MLTHGLIPIDKAGFKEKLMGKINAKYAEYDEIRRRSVEEWLNSNDPSSINLDVVKGRLDFVRSEVRFLKDKVLKT